jgi:hypothetical protein
MENFEKFWRGSFKQVMGLDGSAQVPNDKAYAYGETGQMGNYVDRI